MLLKQSRKNQEDNESSESECPVSGGLVGWLVGGLGGVT